MAVSFFALLRRLISRSPAAAGRGPSGSPPAAKARVAPPASPARRVSIQSLEGRTMYSAGHAGVVVQEQLIGPEAGITSIVLTFNEHLNAASAQNPDAYAVVRRTNQTNTDSGGILGVVLGSGSTTTNSISNKHVRIVAAVYDDANMTVTLTPGKPFKADKFFRMLRVVGKGRNAILDATGEPIDGRGAGKPGTDAIIKFASHKGKRITYRDTDGDRVTLRLTGPGEIRALFRRTGTIDPILFVAGTNAGQSVLTGTVKKARHGDGIANLQELSGVSTIVNDLGNDPQFNIAMTLG